MNISFDIDKLHEIMTHFYTLTKIRIVIFDDSFNKILSVPNESSAFCEALKRIPESKEKCRQCDINARGLCQKTRAMHIYTCHAGLYEAISPLKMNGIILGYVMLGQIIDKSEKKIKKEEILNYAREYTAENLEEAYNKLTTKSKKQIEAAANIMEACACYLWANQLVTVNEDCLSALISKYIHTNLTSDLSVDFLGKHFGISRNKLYKISHNSFGMSIAAYIRKERVANASELLRQGHTVAESAIMSGFNDYNYFSEIFKRETGCLPGKYARSHAKNL